MTTPQAGSAAAAALAKLDAAQQEGMSPAVVAAAFKPNGTEQEAKNAAITAAAQAAPTTDQQVLQLLQQMTARMQQLEDDNLALKQQVMQPQKQAVPVPEKREEKTYYHSTVGSSVVISRTGARGEQIPEVHTFWGGKIITDDPVVQDALDSICDAPSSPVTSVPHGGNAALATISQQIIKAAGDTIEKVGNTAQR